MSWANALVDACQRSGFTRKDMWWEARSILDDIERVARRPAVSAAAHLRRPAEALWACVDRELAAKRHQRARAYEACVLVRQFAADAVEVAARRRV
jgi:hypothetical protein